MTRTTPSKFYWAIPQLLPKQPNTIANVAAIWPQVCGGDPRAGI